MRKNILIITVFIVISLISGLIFLNYYLNKKEAELIQANTATVVRKWGNFTDEAGSDHLADLEPYFSAELMDEYKQSAKEISAYYTKGYGKNSSKLWLDGEVTVLKTNEGVNSTVSVTRYYNEDPKYSALVEINWEKQGKEYKVTKITETRNP